MSPESLTIIVAILGSNLLTGLVTMYMSRRKTSAETSQLQANAAEQITDSAIKLNAEFKDEVTRMGAEIAHLRSELNSSRIAQLELQVRFDKTEQLVKTLMAEKQILEGRIKLCEINHGVAYTPIAKDPPISEITKQIDNNPTTVTTKTTVS